ncbi:MAG: hypothetical protein AB7O78_09275 [Thermoleophilia bacterium]
MVDAFTGDGAAYAHDDIVQCGWDEFIAARDRFFAQLAAQSPGLSGTPGRGYDRDPAEQGEEPWSP